MHCCPEQGKEHSRQDSTVNRVTQLWARHCGIFFLAGAWNFSLLQNVQTSTKVHPPFYSMGTRDSFSGVKVARTSVDHSPSSSAKVKNKWSYTSTLLTFTAFVGKILPFFNEITYKPSTTEDCSMTLQQQVTSDLTASALMWFNLQIYKGVLISP
jgi:hypothetical protein